MCRTLEARFCDNDVIFVFSVLNFFNMLSKRVKLNSWGVTTLEFFFKRYGVQKDLEGKLLSPC